MGLQNSGLNSGMVLISGGLKAGFYLNLLPTNRNQGKVLKLVILLQ